MGCVVKFRAAVLTGSGGGEKSHLSKLFPEVHWELIIDISLMGERCNFFVSESSDSETQLLKVLVEIGDSGEVDLRESEDGELNESFHGESDDFGLDWFYYYKVRNDLFG